MATPDFILNLRLRIGHDPLWLIGVTAVVLNNAADQILLVKRSDNGRWTPITGIVDPGEHPEVAAVREAMEEAGVRIEVERLTLVSVTEPATYPNGDQVQFLDHTYRCRHLKGVPFAADEESTDARWFPLSDLPDMRLELISRVSSAF